MKLEKIKTKKPVQAEYDYFANACLPKLNDTKQLIVKPVEVDQKTEGGIYKPVVKEGEFLPCGYVLASGDEEISPGDLVFWATASFFERFEVNDLKEHGGKYVLIITRNIAYYFKKESLN